MKYKYIIINKETKENIKKDLEFVTRIEAEIYIEDNAIDYDLYKIKRIKIV